MYLPMLVNKIHPIGNLFHDIPNLSTSKGGDKICDMRWSCGWRGLKCRTVYVVFQVPVTQLHIDSIVRTRGEGPMMKNLDNIWVRLSTNLGDGLGFSLYFFRSNMRMKQLPC